MPPLTSPTTEELKAWYAKNSSGFALPSRFSFRHLYFSPDRRGQHAESDAIAALEKIAGKPEDSRAAVALTDRFMFQDYYADRTPAELEKELGSQFAWAIQKLKPRLLAGARRVRLWLAPSICGFRHSRPHSCVSKKSNPT